MIWKPVKTSLKQSSPDDQEEDRSVFKEQVALAFPLSHKSASLVLTPLLGSVAALPSSAGDRVVFVATTNSPTQSVT